MFYIALIGGGIAGSVVMALLLTVLSTRQPLDTRTLLIRSAIVSAACTPLLLGSGGHPPIILTAPAMIAPLLCSPIFYNGALEWLFAVQNPATWGFVLFSFGPMFLATIGAFTWRSRRARSARSIAARARTEIRR